MTEPPADATAQGRGTPGDALDPAAGPGPQAAPPGEAVPVAASKDYWDIVLAQLSRRPSVRIALVLLALLYGLAIYAPFVAGDRPLVLEATDSASYTKAYRMLVPIAANFGALVTGGEAGWKAPAPRAGQPATTFEQALSAERDALIQRIAEMSSQLAESDRDPLVEVTATIEAAHAAALRGDPAGAESARTRLMEQARAIKERLAPVPAGEAPVPGATVALASRTLYPVLEAISRGELYFMGLWLLVLSWPAWNGAVNRLLLHRDRERMRRARRWKTAFMLLGPLLPLPFWTSSTDPYSTSAYKAGLTSGEIAAHRVVMPPVAFGLAEQNDGEYFRPPTWRLESEIRASGEYVRGPRSQRKDPLTGFTVPPQEVELRHGEPDLNAAMRHPLGTDSVGRDLLVRMIWGGRVSLSVGLVSTVFLVFLGTIFGALAGYFGGRTDLVISRIIEVFQCFPPLFLILIVVAFIGPSILNIMVVLGITRWPGVARLVRGEFLRLRGQDFVVASEALGVRQRRTIFRHILPNAMGPVLVIATFSVASGILTESALSFLGFGVSLPVPSWGSLLIESRSSEYWWIQIFPGLMIFLTVTLYNLLGEGVSDALDPRQKI